MITYEQYKQAIENEPKDKEFKKLNDECFIYRGIIIDWNFMTRTLNCSWNFKTKEEDDEEIKIDELFNEGYVRMVGNKIDYVRPHITFSYDYQIEKYKDDIIKYIDFKISHSI